MTLAVALAVVVAPAPAPIPSPAPTIKALCALVLNSFSQIGWQRILASDYRSRPND